MIKIICDSISDIPKEIIDNYNIDILPLRIIINNKEYLDGVDIDIDKYYNILKTEESIPTTSQVPYIDFKNKFEKYTLNGIDVLYVGASSKASGTYQSAYMASKDVQGPGNVHLFDTNSLSVCSGLFVLKACMLKEAGLNIEQIKNELELLKGNEKAAFFVDDLKYLKKGGRISTTKANLGNLLKITPILKIKEGLVVQDSVVRGKKAALNNIININKLENQSNKIVFIGYGDKEEEALEIQKQIKEIDNSINIYIVKIGASVATHSGPSIIGIASI